MKRTGGQSQKGIVKTVQVRLTEDYERKLKAVPGKNDSERIRALIDGGHYLYMPEIARTCVELKDALFAWGNGKYEDAEACRRIRKAGDEICQLLSTN